MAGIGGQEVDRLQQQAISSARGQAGAGPRHCRIAIFGSSREDLQGGDGKAQWEGRGGI